MKKYLFIVVLICFGSSLFSQSSIKLTVTDISDSVAYLGYHFADKRFVLDTVAVNETVVEFTHQNQFRPGLYFLYTPAVYFEFIVNEDEIELSSTGPDYMENLKVIQSKENKIFHEMQVFVTGKRKEYNLISSGMKENTDTVEVLQARKKLNLIDSTVSNYQRTIAANYPGTFVSKMMWAMQKPVMPDSLKGNAEGMDLVRYNYYKDHYFDGVDIADPGLLRTPLLHAKIMEYLDKAILQNPDTVIKEVDLLISISKSNEETYRYLLVTLSNKYETSPVMGHDEVFVHIIEKYYLTGEATWVNDDLIGKLSERIATMKPNFLGNQAPQLVLTDTMSSKVSLYDLTSDYVVLYFYDPDCGHCKEKTPVLFESYSRLQSKSVEILAVNITTNKDRWLEYIRDNGFDWVNLMDENGSSNFRYYYDVRSTPTVFILDKEKKIIAKKLDAAQVEEFINRSIEQADL